MNLGAPQFGGADASDRELARALLAKRLENLASGAPAALAAYCIAVVMLVIVIADSDTLPILLAWGGAIIALVVVRMVQALRCLRGDPDFAEMQRRWRFGMALTMLSSLFWAGMVPWAAWRAQGNELAVVALIVMTILMGTLLYRTPPMASRLHVIALLIGLFAASWIVTGAFSPYAALFCLLLGATLLAAISRSDRAFRDGVAADLARAESEAMVRILLNDYEEHSSDWLWTVAADGSLLEVSPRLAESAGREIAELEGTPLIALFQPSEARDRLAGHIMERSPFRELLLRLRVDGELRYWQVSGRPRASGRLSGVARDVTADRLIEERVAFMAHFDSLTGLANRYLFNERLRRALRTDTAGNVALFCLDLDDFKAINDTRGHLVGDRLLREVGTRLEQEIRPEDTVARLGGDEFAILLETRAGAGMLIERAHRFLSIVREPYDIDGQVYRISTSIGIARCCEGDCDADELMRRADLALFAAKAKGRDALTIYDKELDRAARERREIESDLRDAIARGQLQLHYQPVIDLDNGRTTGYEALLRWYHPQRGILSPNDFLSIAEETGMIVPMGEWIIRQAIAETATWPEDARIAINLSPTQVKSPHLVTVVAQAMHAHAIAPERIEFEITEHVILQQNESSRATLHKLRELGARIALDDFGIGYSSLGYLRSFPFDRIKIDRHFVEGIEDSRDSQAIVSAITRLADALGMATTAEGIENRRQLDMLRKLGCNEAQGFLICEPVPVERLHTGANKIELVDLGADILDYRKAREEALRRGRVA